MMLRYFLVVAALVTLTASARAQGAFVLSCTGSATNDTAAVNTALTSIGSNIATIKLPYMTSSRCTFNSVTLPSNVTLDNSEGSGVSMASGQTLTLSSFTAPRKQAFFGSGSVVFSTSVIVYPEWFGYLPDAVSAADGTTANASTTFSSTSKTCSASTDTGKSIIIYAAGSLSAYSGFNNPLRTTITGCSGSSFVLAASASASIAGTARFVYGTTNTTAAQNAANSLTVGGTLHFTGSAMLGAVTLLSNTTIFAYPNSGTIYSTSTSVFTFSNQSNIAVDGITIDAGGNPSSSGSVTLVGGTTVSNVLIHNCKFLDSFLLNSGNSVPVATFNRHGVLLRDGANWRVLSNDFGPALRVKAAGSGDTNNVEIAFNYFDRTNENGISLLTGGSTSVTNKVQVHHNILNGVIDSGNQITIGDDGGGAHTQTLTNVDVVSNILMGPLPAGVAHIQNKGATTQANISISHNTCDNSAGSLQSNTMCVNNANQNGGGNIVNFTAIGNKANGPYDYAAFRFGSIASGVVANNQVDCGSSGVRGIRFSGASNLIISGNVVSTCKYGLYFNNTSTTGVVASDNLIILRGVNTVAGIEIESQSQTFQVSFARNTIVGAGGSFTGVYGIEDASNGNGNTATTEYIDNKITGITTTTGLGSFKYRTLPANALVTEQSPASIPTLLSATSQLNSATPDVRGLTVVNASNTSPTTVTAINNGSAGRTLTIVFTNGNTTIQNNASIKLNGAANFVGTADDSLTLIWTGSAWQEVSRSIN
jgi:hypothetical protein